MKPLHPNQLRPGDRVRDYRLVRRLGVGGFSFVFLVEHQGQRYVMKMAAQPVSDPDTDPDRVDGWMRREVTSLENLEHPHLLPVYEMGRWPDPRTGYSFYVTKYIEGDTFHVWRRRARATPHAWVDVLCTVLGALEAVHARGMVQRDFKADNVMVRTADAHPFLIDFGSAYVPCARPLTVGVAPGTLYCQPPEVIAFIFSEEVRQKDARFEAHPSADLYGVGCLLHECLTERRPFDPRLPLNELLLSILTTTPPDPRQFNPEAPASLAALAMRLLDKDPEARPASAREVREELERLRAEEGHTTSWQRPSPPPDQPDAQELLSAVPQWGPASPEPEVPPEEEHENKETKRAGRWGGRRLWAGVALALAVLGIGWMLRRAESGMEAQQAPLRAQSTAPEEPVPHAERGPPVQSRQNSAQIPSSQEPSSSSARLRALLCMAVAPLFGCATTPPMREPALDPLPFLEQCSTEARITPRTLRFEPRRSGPNYYWYATRLDTGTPASEQPIKEGGPMNVRSGPVMGRMRPLIGGEEVVFPVAGHAVVTPLRVYIHFDRIQLPDGSWAPICGVASEVFEKEWGLVTYAAEKRTPTPLTRVDRAPGSVVINNPVFMTFIQPADERVRPTFLKMPPPERR